MSNRKLFICFMILSATLLLASCSGTSLEPPPLIEPSLMIELAAGELNTVFVTRGTIEALTIEPGITRFPTVAARLEVGSGHIGAIYAFPGDIVYEGQLLARLHTPELDEDIERVEESIANELELHRLHLRELSAERSLYELLESEDMLALSRLDRRHAIARHELDMEDMEATLDALLEEKERSKIFAPIDGEVVFMLPLETTVTAPSAVAYIAATEGLFVEYTGLPQLTWNSPQIHGVIDGDVYDLSLMLLSRAERNEYARLGVYMPARFSIQSAAPDLLGSGKAVFIRRYLDYEEDALLLPVHALYQTHDIHESFVYRLKDGEQELVYVTTGIVTDSFVQILYGLDEGDEIVVR